MAVQGGDGAPSAPSSQNPSTTAHSTATNSSTSTNMAQQQQQQAAFRPLNVKDALSYLDRVKNTFMDQTEVYDRFLTIMKEFKSQGIDTPGVIERVSTLFRGHPALIQGFNTFLPPGYRIECSISTPQEGAVTTITVTTPMGMTTRTQVTDAQSQQSSTGTSSRPGSTSTPVTSTSASSKLNVGTAAASVPPVRSPLGAGSKAGESSSMHISGLPQSSAASALNVNTPVATPGAASVLSSHSAAGAGSGGVQTVAAAVGSVPSAVASNAAGGESTPQSHVTAAGSAARPPMEFNHAINYVNKIKNRFVSDPDTYKAFLEILQTYQKEGRAIQDVYAQVTTLFHAAPDLLDEFKQFLPDTSAEGQAAAAAANGPLGSRATPSVASNKRPAGPIGQKPIEQQQAPAKKAKTSRAKVDDKSKSKRSTKADGKDLRKGSQADGSYSDAGTSGGVNGPQVGAGSYAQHHMSQYPGYSVPGYPPQPVVPVAYSYETPPPPPPPQPIMRPRPLASQADLAFFQRVKSHTADQTTYHEFLKLLNLYTQDMIDLTALVSRASLFIGQNAALWRDFRDMVGWTDGRPIGDPGQRIEVVDGVRVIENVPTLDGPSRTAADDGKGYKTHGPSYRQLPQSEISLNCSGRDALCWEVLNDQWVSQPSWASDEGFVAHRKNAFEEALHRSEEERHEYDYYIEANLRTIALLEPIATRIAIMEADERATFRLKPGLGNQSKSIYQRVIKQIYGKEQGIEVIQALHENPCVAVPIVLARLKQKDDEWKRALREWNRIWREADAKNYWKALDHQGIMLKANDKRVLTTKALVTEIETIKRAQRQRAAGLGRSLVASTSPALTTQFQFVIDDKAILYDCVKLALSLLDRASSFSNPDKDRIDAFIRQFVPFVFAIPNQEFVLALLPAGGATGGAGGALGDNDDLESLAGASESGTSVVDDSATDAASSVGTGGGGAASTRKGGKKAAAADLRKKVLKNAGGVTPVGTLSSGGKKSSGAQAARKGSASPAPRSRGTSPSATDYNGNAQTEDVSMSDPLPTVASLSTLITPEVEAEIAAHRAEGLGRDGSAVPDSSREASADRELAASASADMAMVERAESEIDAEMTEVGAGTDVDGDDPHASQHPSLLPELIVPVDDRPPRSDSRRQWNTFANSTLYSLVRLFQVLYHRLSLLKNSAVVVARPPSLEPITEKHVPSLSLSLTMQPLKEADAKLSGEDKAAAAVAAEQLYQRALGLCEKLFGGEIDQATFEECLRHMFATQGYMLFTVDKLLTTILKTCQSAIADARSRELMDLLRQDRAHPDRSTPAQQTFYRGQAESALGSDENLYRIEWVPERSTLAIQLLGKDSIPDDDLSVYEREWATYLEQYVLGDPTPGVVSPQGADGRPYLNRNLRRVGISSTRSSAVGLSLPKGLVLKSALQSKICMRSYRLFFVAGTEDELVRYRPRTEVPVDVQVQDKGKDKGKVERFRQFVEKRLEEFERNAAAVDIVEGEGESKRVDAGNRQEQKRDDQEVSGVVVDTKGSETTAPAPASAAESTLVETAAGESGQLQRHQQEESQQQSAVTITDKSSNPLDVTDNDKTGEGSGAVEAVKVGPTESTIQDQARGPGTQVVPAAAEPQASSVADVGADEDVKMAEP